MVAIPLLESIFDELVCACLIDVVLEPWEVELIYTEADEVKERFNIIDWSGCRVHVEFAN